jgi:hypothetical protein
MRVRAQDKNGDYTFGQSQANFLVNNVQAVAQIIGTRMRLIEGEWFLDTADGTPWYTQVLGKYTAQTRDLALQARVLGTPDVNEIIAYQSQAQSPSRIFVSVMTVDTTFGLVPVASPDQPIAIAGPLS